MRPLIFVRRSQVASAFLINDPVELAKMNRVKRDFGKKAGKLRPRLSS
jgi:pseudouridine-5'-phosphate glycosidase